ncbi:MAG TPA: cache domain-containing protein [Chloroflexota bacterium]|nr:cache domain-containing protein [Chloroflexota bacterium]
MTPLASALTGRRIAAKIVLPFIAIMFVLAVGGSLVVMNLVTGSLVERFTNQLLDAGRNVNDDIVRLEGQHLELLRLMANTQGVDAALKSGDAQQLQQLLTPLQANSAFDFVDVVDVKGQQILAIRPSTAKLAQPVDPNLGTWPVTQKSLRGEKDTFGDKWTELEKTTYGPMVYTGGPVLDNANQVVGAILVGIPFDDLLKQLTKDVLANVTVYTSDGQVFGTSLGQAEPLDARSLQRILGDNPQTLQRPLNIGGQGYMELVGGLVIRDKVVGALGVSIPTSAIDQSGQQTRTELTIMFTLVTLVVLAIGLWVARRVASPIDDLVRVCEAARRGDYGQRAKITTKDEAAYIGETLNRLLDELSDRPVDALDGAAAGHDDLVRHADE